MFITIPVLTDNSFMESQPKYVISLLKLFFHKHIALLDAVKLLKEMDYNINTFDSMEVDPVTTFTKIKLSNGETIITPLDKHQIIEKTYY